MKSCRLAVAVVSLLTLLIHVHPAAAQILEPGSNASPFSFPVLGGSSYRIDPQASAPNALFRLADGALQLRSNAAGWIDMDAFCTVPERHWGPVSVVSCTLEVSGRPSHTGLAIPAKVAVAGLEPGSTITLRMLAQAPLIILDLEGNPSAVLDTFMEEFHWTITGGPLP